MLLFKYVPAQRVTSKLPIPKCFCSRSDLGGTIQQVSVCISELCGFVTRLGISSMQ